MKKLAVRQVSGLTAKVEFDEGEWEVTLADPFTPVEEAAAIVTT